MLLIVLILGFAIVTATTGFVVNLLMPWPPCPIPDDAVLMRAVTCDPWLDQLIPLVAGLAYVIVVIWVWISRNSKASNNADA